MFRRAIALLLPLFLLTLAFPPSASGAAATFTIHEDFNFDITLNCASDRADGTTAEALFEDIHIFGSVHGIIHVTEDAGGGYFESYYFAPNGDLTAVGLDSGVMYQATGVDRGAVHLKDLFQVVTEVNSFKIIGPGVLVTFFFQRSFHLTLGADGELVVEMSHEIHDCK
jgi:hypothetical protein